MTFSLILNFYDVMHFANAYFAQPNFANPAPWVEWSGVQKLSEEVGSGEEKSLCVLGELICLMHMALEKEDSSTETFKSVPMPGCVH